jgi:CRP-like cAMP-binding protein
MHKKNIADTARDEAFMRRCKLIPVAADESGLRTLVRAIQADPRTGIMLAFDPPLGNRHSITFLGARLRVATGVGLLADVGRCPVIPWFWEYTASGPRVVIEKPIVVDERWPLPLRRNAIVERLYALLAERVARIPEQWHLDFVHQGVVDERPKAPERQLCGRFAVSLADLFRNEPDIVRYAAGDVIFSAGDDADAMYVVIEGDVEIRLKDIAIDVAHVGEIVGEMALIDHSPRSASVIALSASRLARIDRRRFLYLIQNTPTFALDVMTVMAGRLRRGNALRERLESST